MRNLNDFIFYIIKAVGKRISEFLKSENVALL